MAPAALISRQTARVCSHRPTRGRSSLRTTALLGGGGRGPLASAQDQATRFLQRYEQNLLPSGVGALAVTSYCVARGQSPATALAITVVATISALVLNELLFSDDVRS